MVSANNNEFFFSQRIKKVQKKSQQLHISQMFEDNAFLLYMHHRWKDETKIAGVDKSQFSYDSTVECCPSLTKTL